MVKRLVELINQLQIRSAKQTPTATWDESSVVRPQFQRAVRIEKIVPLPSTGFSGSYFGGKPTLPDDVEWPSFDGEPMLFLGQINCIELPELIWGGVGPRNGWLLFFLQYTVSDGGQNLQCKVLHVDGAGKERSVDISNDLRENAAWLWRSMKARLATTATPFHKWPVRLIEVDETKDGTTSYEGKNPPVPSEASWDIHEKMYPVTWVLLEELVNQVSTIFDLECTRYKNLWKRYYSGIQTYRNKSAAERSYRDELHYEICQTAQKELREHAGKLAEDKERFDRLISSLKFSGDSALVDQFTWCNFVETLSELSIAKTSWAIVRPESPTVFREIIEYGTTFDARPETYGDYAKELTRIIVTNSEIVKGSGTSGRRLSLERRLANERECSNEVHDAATLDPDILEYYEQRKQVLQQNVAELEKAQAFLPDSLDRAWKLRDNIGGHQRYKDKLTDDDWAAIRPELQGLITATNEQVVAIHRIVPLEKTQFKRGPLIDFSDYRFADWKQKQRAELLRQYSTEPNSLPLATRQYQEHQCLEYAAGVHDGMGGIPRWDWVYEEFFRPYLSPQLRGNAEFDTGRTASGQPPFDKDNAVLLQLFSSEIPGWIFGDVSHIVLIIPRENLARGDFSSIKVVVQG